MVLASDKIKPDGTPLYPFQTPDPVYVKAFLLAALGDAQEGKRILREYLAANNDEWSPDLALKVMSTLDGISLL